MTDTPSAFPAPRRQECLVDAAGDDLHIFELGRPTCFCGKQAATAPPLNAPAPQPGDEPDSCPRCSVTVNRPSQGGPDCPLCDDCWAKCSPYRRGWWAGFDGWGSHNSETTPKAQASYDAGYENGVKAREAKQEPPKA